MRTGRSSTASLSCSASLDPHGRVVPETIVDRMNAPLVTTTLDALVRCSRFASQYAEGSPAWRRIAVAASKRTEDLGLGDEDRRRVYSSILSHRSQSWSGLPKKLHPRWQDAIDSAQKALEGETEPALRPFWQWRLENARHELEREKGRLEEGV